MDCMSTMKKDNTGYDLKHLFIGSEGTLGLVTKVAIQCPPKPNAVNLAILGWFDCIYFGTIKCLLRSNLKILLLGLNDFKSVLATFKRCKRDLGEILSSCEYIDTESMRCVTRNLNLKCPVGEFPFYMLVETSGSSGNHDEEKLNKFLEDILTEGIVSDGTVASGPSQMLVREKTDSRKRDNRAP